MVDYLVEIPEDELIQEVLPEVDREELDPEELKGLEEAGLEIVRIPQIRPFFPRLKRELFRSSLVRRGALYRAMRRAALVGARKAMSKVQEGDSVFFFHGQVPKDSTTNLRFFSSFDGNTNIKKAGIQNDRPMILTGIGVVISPSVVGKDTEWSQIVKPMLNSVLTLRVSRDNGDKILEFPSEILAANVSSVATAVDGAAALTTQFYLTFNNARFGSNGLFPIRVYVPPRKSVTVDLDFNESFSGNTLYWYYVLLIGKEV